MMVEATEEQMAAVEMAAADGSLMISAFAGCAKSSTLEMMAPQIRVPALALAFNKKIATDIGGRLPANFEVRTLNALGHAAWSRRLGGRRLKVDDRKVGVLVTEVLKESKIDRRTSAVLWDYVRTVVSRAMQVGLLPQQPGRFAAASPLVADTDEEWMNVGLDCGVPIDVVGRVVEFARIVLIRSVELSLDGVICFDDQIFCPVVLGAPWPKFPCVFVDESQDLSPLNHAQVGNVLRAGGKLVAVGDEKQCHPPGTQILKSGNNGYCNIEEIQIGDEIVSYNRKVGFTGLISDKPHSNPQGRKVLNKITFRYSGLMVRIQAGQFAHDCTPNHRCLVRLASEAINGYCVYLMQKGNQFRIGISKIKYNEEKGSFGPAMRARQEGADALWILKYCHNKEEAQIDEKVIWTLFGLPDLIFRSSGKLSSTQKHLDQAWDAIGDNTIRAKNCLAHFKRDIKFPLWTKENNIHIGVEVSFITQACNIVSGVMAIRTIAEWEQCFVENYDYDGSVIGLTVESNGYGMNLYVANGIVTHNSIYSWRGADAESMKNMRNLAPSWIDLPLTMTFRCPKVVVARQQSHAKGFRAFEGNREGQFLNWVGRESGWSIEDVAAADVSVAVLCRNNAPLLRLAFRLLRRRVGVVMLGRDIGKGLVALSKKICPDDETSSADIEVRVRGWMEGEISAAIAAGRSIDGVEDRGECLLAVLESASSAGQLRTLLEELFSRTAGHIVLSSIHRAKGLEWDFVVHLDPWRIPSKQALRAGGAALAQEWNLKYVCETRTRDVLVEANLEEMR